jgi:hypothetical protein
MGVSPHFLTCKAVKVISYNSLALRITMVTSLWNWSHWRQGVYLVCPWWANPAPCRTGVDGKNERTGNSQTDLALDYMRWRLCPWPWLSVVEKYVACTWTSESIWGLIRTVSWQLLTQKSAGMGHIWFWPSMGSRSFKEETTHAREPRLLLFLFFFLNTEFTQSLRHSFFLITHCFSQFNWKYSLLNHLVNSSTSWMDLDSLFLQSQQDPWFYTLPSHLLLSSTRR